MSSRFFTLDPLTADQIQLVDDQAHHLLHVMRIKIGEQVTVFDGSGTEATATVVSSTKRDVDLKINQRRTVDRELPVHLTLAVAIPKGDRQKVLVEKLVEVGVSTLIPVSTERSVAQPNEKALQRLRKSVIEASKQCERNLLMQIAAPVPFSELVADLKFESTQKLIATTHTATATIASVTTQSTGDQTKSIEKQKFLVAIGPEGGFSKSENELAAANGFLAVQLGQRILRVETAAIVVAALLGVRGETNVTELH